MQTITPAQAAALTEFQRQAINQIGRVGGSIFYATNRSWIDDDGNRVLVPAADQTVGFIGWPTINALMVAGALVNKRGNEYALTRAA